MNQHLLIVGAVLVLNSVLPARHSATQNIDLMAKWTAATIVNYKVTAEFSGSAVLFTADGLRGLGVVSDRFEAQFDWNQAESAMVGKPIIRNFPSKLVSVTQNGNCPVAVSGAFEHATILEIRNDPALAIANAVHAEVQRDLPSGTLATVDETGPCASIKRATARSVRQRLALPAPNGMMLAMPTGQAGYQHNGKSFTIAEKNAADKGWTYTVTPTIVK